LTQREVVRYYRQEVKVKNYERARFSTTGGRLVDEVEKGIIMRFSGGSDRKGRVLDLGTGTGRVAALICNRSKVGVDSSLPMVREARRRKLDVVCSHLGYLPFKGDSFSTAIALRVFIREKDPLQLFKETARVLGEGGCLVFDTSNRFSVGFLLNQFSQEPKHNTFSAKEVRTMLRMSSFKNTQKEPAFILPRGIYQRINSKLAQVLWKIEKTLLKTILNRAACTHFWRARLG